MDVENVVLTTKSKKRFTISNKQNREMLNIFLEF